MSDDVQCVLGRLEQRIEDIKTDIEEIKQEQKRLADYINAQKIGVRFLIAVATTVGATIIGFPEEVTKLLGIKIPN